MSPRRIFVTGSTGFIGHHLLEEWRAGEVAVTALDRSGSLASRPPRRGVRVVRGDLLDPDTYRDALAECDTVVHLAAATGNASRESHHRNTVQATAYLCEAARAAGVQRFLLVSSIAVSFPDRSAYPYALAKEEAERLVSDAGMRYTIVRPTIVLGPGAPSLKSMTALATLPLIVVPGTGRVRVQPIAVTDLVLALATIIREDRFANGTIALGGPEILSMDELLQHIRQARGGRRGHFLHLPLPLLQIPLRLAEAAGLGRLLPVTAGQLSSFRFDGVVRESTGRADATSMEDMLAMAVRRGPDEGATLERECRVFARHLLGWSPDEVTVGAYRRAVTTVPALVPTGPRDRAILAFARRGWIAARLADSWAALFARSSTLRKRLVLLLAIMESRSPTAAMIDRRVGGSAPLALVALGGRSLLALGGLALGALVMTPIALLSRRHDAGA